MTLVSAIKAFFKAFKDPKKTEEFLNDTPTLCISKSPADPSHIRLLGALQQTGRFIDFLKEDIKDYSDAQVGAAVRQIHQDCSRIVEEMVTIRSVLEEEEGTTIKVPQGYDPSQIKLVGKVDGKGPYTGKVVHKGWIAHKRSLPKNFTVQNPDVIAPAEVEVR